MVMEISKEQLNAARIDLRKLPVLAKQQISSTRLPDLYKSAIIAVRDCARIDELKDIKDKHSAIAHYAKQSKDNSLFYYAQRIQLRAFIRIGELLSEIDCHDDRTKAARESGVAAHRVNPAIDAARIPKKTREKLIEMTPPPTQTKMSDYGKGYIHSESQFRSEGLDKYIRREQDIRPSPQIAAGEILRIVRAFFREAIEILDDKSGRHFSMAQLGRELCTWNTCDVTLARAEVINIIEMLDEFEQGIPRLDSQKNAPEQTEISAGSEGRFRKCIQCKKLFEPARSDAKYCCPACRQAACRGRR